MKHKLAGLQVILPAPCTQCGGDIGVIRIEPRNASIKCLCGRRAGNLSAKTFNFISETVRLWGKPHAPIGIKTPSIGGVVVDHNTTRN